MKSKKTSVIGLYCYIKHKLLELPSFVTPVPFCCLTLLFNAFIVLILMHMVEEIFICYKPLMIASNTIFLTTNIFFNIKHTLSIQMVLLY